jgi:hypothetical protein
MMGRTSLRRPLCVTSIALALTAAAHAVERPTAIDTFVSGLGNDSNASTNCPRASPCRTFAAAYPVTHSGGDIIALDPADYGPLTITGPISILGVEGAIIAVASGTTGIAINAPASDKIVIKDLSISGAGESGTTGIALANGRLVLRNTTLKLLTTGLSVSDAKADLLYVDIIGNTTGIAVTGAGVNTSTFPLTGTAEVRLFFGSAVDNATAYVMTNPGGAKNNPNFSILEYITSNTDAAFSTYMAGNATLVSGSGSTCHVRNSGFSAATATRINTACERRRTVRLHPLAMADTFPAGQLGPYWPYGEKPRPAARAERTRSGQAFEKGSG